MYLRDPERYAVWITATIDGLRRLTGNAGGSKNDGRRSYLQSCEQLRTFCEKYHVAPQEVDAILSEAVRQALTPPAPPVVPKSDPSVEALATACSLPVEQVEEWANLLRGPKRHVFYGPPGTGKTYVALSSPNTWPEITIAFAWSSFTRRTPMKTSWRVYAQNCARRREANCPT